MPALRSQSLGQPQISPLSNRPPAAIPALLKPQLCILNPNYLRPFRLVLHFLRKITLCLALPLPPRPLFKTNSMVASYLVQVEEAAAAAAAKSLQSCQTLCDPIDSSPLGSSVPGILQARILEWVAISFSNARKWKVKVKLLSRARLLVTPWTGAYQAPRSMGSSRQEYWSWVPLKLLHPYLTPWNPTCSTGCLVPQQGRAGFGKECKSQQKSSTLNKQKPRARWLHWWILPKV